MMTPRALQGVRFLVCAVAIGGCQLVSGASSLEITGDGGTTTEPEGGGLDATNEAAPDARVDAPVNEGGGEQDAPFVACTMPTGGAFTACRVGGLPVTVTSCVEYCATLRKCCAEDCKPFSTDQSVKDALLVADTLSTCVDPLSGPPVNGFTSCGNSPIPGADKAFKCCCR